MTRPYFHYLAPVFAIVLIRTALVAEPPNPVLSRSELVGTVACMERNANEIGLNFLPWSDGTHHIKYKVFDDPNENAPGMRLVYVLAYNPDRKSGSIQKLYVGINSRTIEFGQTGTTKLTQSGKMEIDDVWGGLATHKTLTQHIHAIESEPLIIVDRTRGSLYSCSTQKHWK
jgi:hypothetical protein